MIKFNNFFMQNVKYIGKRGILAPSLNNRCSYFHTTVIRREEEQDMKSERYRSKTELNDLNVYYIAKRPDYGEMQLIKQEKRKPFFKNLCMATVDRELISYPQVLNKERFEHLEHIHKVIWDFFNKNIDNAKIDSLAELSEQNLADIKTMGLFGLIIPEEYGGLGYTQTEFVKILEAVSQNGSIAVSIVAHQCLAARAIMKYGSIEQKARYLPKMATGEKIAAFCFTEPSGGSDPHAISTLASFDDPEIVIKGNKTWVTNGTMANLFIVIANEDYTPIQKGNLTTFIVEKDESVSVEKQNVIGLRGAGLANVTFKNSVVTTDSIIGDRKQGLDITVDAYQFARIGLGAICTSLGKKVVDESMDYVLNRTAYDMNLSDLGSVREKISNMSAYTYAIESKTYWVAGMDDLYIDQDYTIESAALKSVSSELLREICELSSKILATGICQHDSPIQMISRDSILLNNFLGSCEVVTLMNSLDCLSHCGNNLSEFIVKKRRIFEHPNFNLKEAVKVMFGKSHKMANMFLEDYYHPALEIEAQDLEKMVSALSFTIEKALVLHGSQIVTESNQYVVYRIGLCMNYTTTLIIALARASRALCLGIPYADKDVSMVLLLFRRIAPKIDLYLEECERSLNRFEVGKVNDIGKTLMEAKKYQFSSPYFRFVW